jgi:hypothetical protein
MPSARSNTSQKPAAVAKAAIAAVLTGLRYNTATMK